MASTRKSPSFSPEELMRIIKSDPVKFADVLKSMNNVAKTERNDTKIVQAFLKAGYKADDVVLLDPARTLAEQPSVTILTYNKWFELGRKVKVGETALRIKGYHIRLFHRDQTEVASPAERKAYHKKMQEIEAKRTAKATQPQA